MTDTIKTTTGVAPQYLIFEHDAAWGRPGTTWFDHGYEPENAPAEKPQGRVSRFEVPTVRAMPQNVAIALKACDDVAAMLPKLTDQEAQLFAMIVRDCDRQEATWEQRTSLVLSGWRYGDMTRLRASIRRIKKATAPRRGR